MAGVSYEEGKKQAYRGFYLLGVITIIEVIIALFGNGHLIDGVTLPKFIMYPVMIGLSLYKAYFIVNEFMHMRYEAKALSMTVVLPTLLLVWAVIAFLHEGNAWSEKRKEIDRRNSIEKSEQTGYRFVEPKELEGIRFI